MSRWVRCSYGKRAGFVGAKIGFISESSKLFETFLQFSLTVLDMRTVFVAFRR